MSSGRGNHWPRSVSPLLRASRSAVSTRGSSQVALTGVDDDAVSGEDEVVTVPVVEVKPVVRPDDETKQTVRPSAAKLVKGVDHIGWTWEFVLEVADAESLMAFDGKNGEAVAAKAKVARDGRFKITLKPMGGIVIF